MGLTAAGAGAVLFFRGFVLAPFTQLRLSSVVVGESQERCHGGRSYFVLDVVKHPVKRHKSWKESNDLFLMRFLKEKVLYQVVMLRMGSINKGKIWH